MLRRTTLRLGSRLYSLDTPLVMGIINVTPDSFLSPMGPASPMSEPTARVQEGQPR